MAKLSHIDDHGAARMVDVSDKELTNREALAKGSVIMKKETLRLIRENKIAKGDVLAAARIAGIMASKKTADMIPLCHPLSISSAGIEFEFDKREDRLHIFSKVKCTGPTGVEMEALTAVSAAALTIYDMCKSADREMIISDILLLEKRGGKSGIFKRL
jgi:cyclic pyranopterin monophosphate synthase